MPLGQPEPVLAEHLESLSIIITPNPMGTFMVQWVRSDYWRQEAIDSDEIHDVDMEAMAYQLFHLVMPWLPGQIVHSRQIASQGSD